jgi:adenosylcobinamide-phosphate synthase
VRAATLVYPPFGFVLSVLLISTTLASKGLAQAGMAVFRELAAGRLPEARAQLARVVGRDSGGLPMPDVVRGTVETVAENTVDAVVAPLFYAFLGGSPLALAYRAVNTLDSMLGYRNEKYRDFGWAAAKLDDLANYIPARLGGVLLCLLAPLVGGTWRRTFAVWRRDRRAHPSPNSGHPEAAVAGALGVRLGGGNHYQGVLHVRPYLGDPAKELAPEAIPAAIRLMAVAGYATAVGGYLLVASR